MVELRREDCRRIFLRKISVLDYRITVVFSCEIKVSQGMSDLTNTNLIHCQTSLVWLPKHSRRMKLDFRCPLTFQHWTLFNLANLLIE